MTPRTSAEILAEIQAKYLTVGKLLKRTAARDGRAELWMVADPGRREVRHDFNTVAFQQHDSEGFQYVNLYDFQSYRENAVQLGHFRQFAAEQAADPDMPVMYRVNPHLTMPLERILNRAGTPPWIIQLKAVIGDPLRQLMGRDY